MKDNSYYQRGCKQKQVNKVWSRQNKLLFSKLLLLAAVLLVTISGLAGLGCVGRGSNPTGWSGSVVANGNLFLGATEGKLIAVNTSNGNLEWEVILEAPPLSGGDFGCAPASPVIAIYGTPAVVGDSIYVGGYIRSGKEDFGKIYAFSFGRDEARWIYPRQDTLDNPIVGGPVVSQGRVYIASSDGKVYALDAAEGYTEWEEPFETGGKIWSTPAIDGNTLFIGSFNKKLYAIDATDGSPKWQYETGGAIAATPLIYDNTVYVGSFDRYLYAVNATDGSLRWKSSFSGEKWFWARPVVYNDVIYAGCLDGKVYAVDAKQGDKIAEFDLGSPISSSPALFDSLVVFACENGQVWTIDTVSNSKKLLSNVKGKIQAPLLVSNGVIYVRAQKENILYAVNAHTGTVLWDLSLSSK